MMDRMMAKGQIMKAIAVCFFLAATVLAGPTAPRVNEFWYATEVQTWNEAAGYFVYSAGAQIPAPTGETDYPYIVITRIAGDFVNIPYSQFAVERVASYDKAAARAAATNGRVTTAAGGAILVYYRK